MSLLLHALVRRSISHIKLNSFRVFGNSLSQNGSALRLKLTDCVASWSGFCSRAYDVNTNVAKDVILFKYENPKFYRMLNLFAIVQFAFWNYLSVTAFTTLKDAPIEVDIGEDEPWYRRINLGENKYRNGITIFCFMIGYGILTIAWMFSLRSVRFLVLRRGGKDLSFVTYGPFGKNQIITVPIKNCSAQESRQTARVQLPIKIQNKLLHYVLDMRGEFKNPKLFDYTAGLRRKLQ